MNIFKHLSQYSTGLPYNLNWMLPQQDPLISNLACGSITIVDVGCRWGLPNELWPLRHLLHYICFDADQEECNKLNSQQHDLLKRDIFPIFIGDNNGQAEFYLFKSRGQSSALRPDPRFTRLFADSDFTIDKTITVQTTTLDCFYNTRPELPMPDMIKLDTQGTELAILQNGVKCLQSSSLVEIEVEFLPHYEGQALFPEIMQYMLDSGFEILYLNRVFQQRNGYTGFAKGQITFGDALFARREDYLSDFDEPKLIRYIVLLINYGHLDMAYNIFTNHTFDPSIKSIFDAYFLQRKGRSITNKFRRIIIPRIDRWLVQPLLHLRKHNVANSDSDRSWPFR